MIIVTLAGLGVGGALVTAPVYMTEVSPPLARSRLMLGGQVVGFGFVILVASVPALYLLPAFPGPFVLTFAVFPLLLIPVLIFALPESPRWLEGKGRIEQERHRHQAGGQRPPPRECPRRAQLRPVRGARAGKGAGRRGL